MDTSVKLIYLRDKIDILNKMIKLFLTPTPCSMLPGEFKRQAAIRPRSITLATAQALSP
ncbi:hypothetical protein Bmyc01_60030 [Bacillus mycoides]|nr:hypothetical protein Bmyc01_60030 [Bacillus mycoides]